MIVAEHLPCIGLVSIGAVYNRQIVSKLRPIRIAFHCQILLILVAERQNAPPPWGFHSQT